MKKITDSLLSENDIEFLRLNDIGVTPCLNLIKRGDETEIDAVYGGLPQIDLEDWPKINGKHLPFLCWMKASLINLVTREFSSFELPEKFFFFLHDDGLVPLILKENKNIFHQWQDLQDLEWWTDSLNSYKEPPPPMCCSFGNGQVGDWVVIQKIPATSLVC